MAMTVPLNRPAAYDSASCPRQKCQSTSSIAPASQNPPRLFETALIRRAGTGVLRIHEKLIVTKQDQVLEAVTGDINHDSFTRFSAP